MVNRCAVRVLLVNGEYLRSAVRRPCTALVSTVLTDQQLAPERVIIGCEADRVAVPVSPPDRLDG
jgi:hypothetical protein